MEKNRFKLVHACSVIMITLGAGCTQSTQTPAAFQGPQNPSFETKAYWIGAVNYLTGTGFLPSQGVYYASLNNVNNGDPDLSQVNFYQDSVDFSQSSTMTFDYTFSYQAPNEQYINHPIQYPGSVTTQILFTSNGTATLWQQTAAAATPPGKILNETIKLPSLPSPGRLLIQLSANDSGSGLTPGGTFSIDNIRVN